MFSYVMKCSEVFGGVLMDSELFWKVPERSEASANVLE